MTGDPLPEKLPAGTCCFPNDGLRFEREGRWSSGPSESGAAGGRSKGSGAAYLLPDGSIRFADASWMTQEQWDSLGEAQDGSTFPICPRFVVEVRSPGQTLANQQEKLERWIGYGATLGWLVDQNSASVWVYRPDQARRTAGAPRQRQRRPRTARGFASTSPVSGARTRFGEPRSCRTSTRRLSLVSVSGGGGRQADGVLDFGEDFACDHAGAAGAVGEHFVDLVEVGGQLGATRADRLERGVD